MRVCAVVGARPQFVKAFPVSRRLREDHEEVLVHTGQHYDEALSDVFFEELAIPEPDHHLGVGSGSHATQTAAIMTAFEDVLATTDPEAVLVYGDTNSTLAAALVAAKVDPALVHVEAGLRSHNWAMPEEVNRVVTDHCSTALCAPTDAAVDNLRREGLVDGVHRTGDVMYDAVLAVRDRASAASGREGFGLSPGEYVLATVHRAGNTDDPDRLRAILAGLGDGPHPVVLPVHPRTRSAIEEYDLAVPDSVRLIDPVGYLTLLDLLADADRVATDSGGVQKEAFFLDTPCVTLREETEWVETVACGWNVLVGADRTAIARALARPFDLDSAEKPTPYGDGNAADAVVEAVEWAVDGSAHRS